MTTDRIERLDRIETLLDDLIKASVDSTAKMSERIDQVERESDTKLTRIEALVEKNVESINLLQQDIRRWDERFFQLSRDNVSVSKAILLATSTVVVISALAPAFKLIAGILFGTPQP